MILRVPLDDMQALERYWVDKYHKGAVKEYMHAHTVSSIALDCEV